MMRTGCQWRKLPKEFPPHSTVQRYFYFWREDGRWQRINHELLMQARLADGREANPSVGIIDSQSVKTTESGGPREFDARKKVIGRKRHILIDTGGLLVTAIVHSADNQDRDGAPSVPASNRKTCPWLRHVFADGVYSGKELNDALQHLGHWTLKIVRRSDVVKGFEVLPRRWVVEGTFAWLSRNRRLAKDFESSVTSAEA